MDADYDIFEVVTVIRDFWLVDAESYQRRYYTECGEALMPGYYVVNWPEHILARRFNEHAVFNGPFNFRKEAQAVVERLRQERILIASLAIPPVTVPNFNSIEIRKMVKQRLRLIESAKTKSRITQSLFSDFRKTTTAAIDPYSSFKFQSSINR